MSGLGAVSEGNGLYLSIAGGFIWNRKADASDPNYAEQTYVRADKTEGVRAGARYADLTGKVVGVQFRTHDDYGESINIKVAAGEDIYIVSISTNNRYSQDFMKALLKMNLEKPLFIKPYDFVGSDKKRAMGISFRQDGEKLDLKIENAPSKEGEWFKTAQKKDIKRFFEDLNDWFVAEVEEKVVPLIVEDLPETPKQGLGKASESVSREDDVESKPKAKESKKAPEVQGTEVSPLKKKKALREYIAENYPDNELPNLSKADLDAWYELCLAEEELPFPNEAEVSESDLDSQLGALLDK